MSLLNNHISLTGMPKLHTKEEVERIERKQAEALHALVKQKNTTFVWRNIAMSAIIESVIYMAQDEIFNVSDLDEEETEKLCEELDLAIYYRDECNRRFISNIDKEENFTLDFQESVQSKSREELAVFCRVITENAISIGVTQHAEAVGCIIAAMRLIETLNVLFNANRQMEWYKYIKKNSPIERGLQMMDYTYKHLGSCLDILDPEMPKTVPTNENIDKPYNHILKIWSSSDLYAKGISSAEKEEEKGKKAKKKDEK